MRSRFNRKPKAVVVVTFTGATMTRRMSTKLDTIVEVSPQLNSGISPQHLRRRMSLGVNIPVNERPPRSAQPLKTVTCPVRTLSPIKWTGFKTISTAQTTRRQSLGPTNTSMAALPVPRTARRQSLPLGRPSAAVIAVGCSAYRNINQTKYSNQKIKPKEAMKPPFTPRRPKPTPKPGVQSGIPSYARPTASSLRHSKQ